MGVMATGKCMASILFSILFCVRTVFYNNIVVRFLYQNTLDRDRETVTVPSYLTNTVPMKNEYITRLLQISSLQFCFSFFILTLFFL